MEFISKLKTMKKAELLKECVQRKIACKDSDNETRLKDLVAIHAYNQMNREDLLQVCKQQGIRCPPNAKKEQLINILESDLPTIKMARLEKLIPSGSSPKGKIAPIAIKRKKTAVVPTEYEDIPIIPKPTPKPKPQSSPKQPKPIPSHAKLELFALGKDQINYLLDFTRKNPGVELEIRFGTYSGKNFISSVSRQIFNKIRNLLMSYRKRFQIEHENKMVEIYGNISKIIDLDEPELVSFRHKSNMKNVDNPDYGYRISLSSEENLRPQNLDKYKPDATRIKKRVSFLSSDESSIFYDSRIDLTESEMDGRIQYEVELEILNKKNSFDYQVFAKALVTMILLIQGYNLDYSDFLEDSNLDRFKNLYMSEHEIAKYSGIFNQLVGGKKNRFDRLATIRNEPKNIKAKDFISMPLYYVTSKLDGVRYFYLTVDKNTFLVQPPNIITRVSDSGRSQPSLVDGELINEKIYIFDCLVADGKNLMTSQFKKRKEAASAIAKAVASDKNSLVKPIMKNFYSQIPIYKCVQDALNDNKKYEKQGLKTDGLIFQPNAGAYENNETYKWKPVNQLTIDFKVIPVQDSLDKYNLAVGLDKQDVAFRGSIDHPYLETVKFKDGLFEGQSVENAIIEFSWNGGNFKPERFRPDKPYPNRSDVADSVWADIHNPVLLSTITGQDLVVMRKYHNQVKDKMLTSYLINGQKILDIGSGQGGDIFKWKKMGLDVIAVEPDKKMVENLKSRARNADFPIKIVNTGGEDTEKIVSVSGRVNAVTAFFSLTFFQKDEETLDGLINTIDKTLYTDGHLLGIVLDGEKVFDLLAKNDGSVDNPAFSFNAKSELEQDKYGQKIKINIKDETSFVKDVTEYLFFWKLFVKKLQDINIQLVEYVKGETFAKKSGSYEEKSEESEGQPEDYGESERSERDSSEREDSTPKGELSSGRFESPKGKGRPVGERVTITSFLNGKGIGLGEYASMFTKLNRCFVFKRMAEVVDPITLNLRNNNIKKDQGFYSMFADEIFLKPGITGPSSFLSAALYDYKNYKDALKEGKEAEFVKDTRKKLATITMTDFEKLADGHTLKVLARAYEKVGYSPETAKKQIVENFKTLFSDPRQPIYDNLEFIQYISDKLKSNIFIISNTSRDVYLPMASQPLDPKIRCDLLYKPDRRSIIIMNFDNVQFDRVSYDGHMAWKDFNDPIIQTLYKRICPEQVPQRIASIGIVPGENAQVGDRIIKILSVGDKNVQGIVIKPPTAVPNIGEYPIKNVQVMRKKPKLEGEALLFKPILITAGPYKGYTGVVKTVLKVQEDVPKKFKTDREKEDFVKNIIRQIEDIFSKDAPKMALANAQTLFGELGGYKGLINKFPNIQKRYSELLQKDFAKALQQIDDTRLANWEKLKDKISKRADDKTIEYMIGLYYDTILPFRDLRVVLDNDGRLVEVAHQHIEIIF